MGRVVHFEIQADDIERAKKFYESVFGWNVQQWMKKEEKGMNYWGLVTGESGPGINGGMYERATAEEKYYMYDCTIGVEDIDKAVEAVKANGGTITREIDELKGVGFFASAKDTEGNRFAMIEPTDWEMPVKRNAVGWFELPVLDMDRAVKFYETVFDVKLERHPMGPLDMAWFPMMDNGNGSPGSLVKHEFYKPSKEGALLYFTATSGDLNNELGRVEAAGGKICKPRKQISEEYGYMAVIEDTEGNWIALHSRK